MKVLIIEDELMNVEDLKATLLATMYHVEVVKALHSVKEAIAYLQHNNDYDVIFSDIQLGDGLCFEVFEAVHITKPVIFCTAFNQYMMEAFKTNGIDYILKPFDKAAIENALNKYHHLKQSFSTETQVDKLLQFLSHQKKENTSVLVYYKDKILPVEVENIALFYIEREAIKLVCFDSNVYYINANLDQLEAGHPHTFFRANRQNLVNRRAVKEASKVFGRKLNVHLTVPVQHDILINKTKISAFLNWLSNH